MRIFIKIVLVALGLGLAGAGGWTAAVGFAYSDSGGRFARYKVPAGAELVGHTRRALRKIPAEFQEYRKYLKEDEYGMAIPLGGGGILIVLIGLVFVLNGVFRFKKKPKGAAGTVRGADSGVISDKLISDIRKETVDETAKKGGAVKKISIDDSLLDPEEEKFSEKLRDVGYLVQIAQGDLMPDDSPEVVRMFRPDLAEYLDLFEGSSTLELALQIVRAVILRHHRTKEDTTADQFKAQDDRINECERHTFARRFMPAKHKITSDMRAVIGKVYSVNEQAAVQQQFSGEAEDWADLSLRNAKDVLAAKTALETDASAPETAA